MQYNIVTYGGHTNITAVILGKMYVADETHPQFDRIFAALTGPDAEDIEWDIAAMFDATHRAASEFERLTERVTVANSRIYVDGDELDDVYAEQIVRFLDEGVDDWEPLANFLENVYTNTDEHTRENLSRWLNATRGFSIDPDGYIVGYKGVQQDLTSCHAGPAIVDGKAVDGHVPNQPGSIVEMARSQVTNDPSIGCAAGLHVGTWNYASSFGAVVLEVRVNPRDVVSVPTDCGDQKMRVSRYEVVGPVDTNHDTALVGEYSTGASAVDEVQPLDKYYDYWYV